LGQELAVCCRDEGGLLLLIAGGPPRRAAMYCLLLMCSSTGMGQACMGSPIAAPLPGCLPFCNTMV